MQQNDQTGVHIFGHLTIHDPFTGDVYVNKNNAIHYENFSIALAQSISNNTNGLVSEMSFGNGGTAVDPTGIITYLSPNSSGSNASLYNQTYSKVIDSNSISNVDPTRNYIEVRHVAGTTYTDMLVTCLLDYSEPNGQSAFDSTSNQDNNFMFDEIGLKSSSGMLLTHVIFHPVLKSLNRIIQIDYTVRIQTLSGEII
jgi:hypothetical protein